MTTFRLTERAQTPVAAIDIDEDSFLLNVHLAETVATEQGEPKLLSEALAASLGVQRRNCILTIGDLVLVVGAQDRLRSLDWRFGPAVLRSGLVIAPSGPAATLQIDATWDENDRADIPSLTVGVFDRTSLALSIELGPEPSHWGYVAQGVAVGLSQSGALVRVVLRKCPLDLCALVGDS